MSAAIIVGTLPLIPVFMVLIGWATQNRMDRQWLLLSQLSGHFLDVVAGLPTLKVFGRAKAQAASIRTITAEYRRATMRTLRIAFISSFALELLATLSVALVAVTIGMRLVHGELDLYTGLLILILAPEAYLPLRQVGTQYHAAAAGLGAAEEIFAVLETPAPVAGKGTVPQGALAFENVTVRYPGRSTDAVTDVTFTVAPGETVALVGPSGSGKSTLTDRRGAGLRPPRRGPGERRRGRPHRTRHRRLAPPRGLGAAAAPPVRRDDRGERPAGPPRRGRRSGTARPAGRGCAGLRGGPPRGADTVLGEDGTGLSAGQRQRLALARAFLADRPVMLLDEPTAALDGATEAEVVAAVRRLAEGRTVLLVVHRPALLAAADRVVRLPAAEVHRESAAGAVANGRTGADTVRGAAPDQGSRPETVPDERAEKAPGRVLARVRALSGARRGRITLALLLGALALVSAVGLMATSGWLISRASQQPPVLYLMMAVTATRAFGIGRAVFRYAERLVSHDAVLRMLADTRVAVYRRLERLAPAGLRGTRRGDLLTRLVSDVDALQDYWLRWLLPAGAAVAVSTLSVGFTTWLLPEAGAVLAAGLLAAGVGVPLLTAAVARRTERRLAPARGDLATRVTDLLTGTAELTVAGALPARAEGTRRADGVLTRIASRSAALTGLGDGLTALFSGLTVAAAGLVGVQGVTAGRLDGVALAVVVLTPLAAFEAASACPSPCATGSGCAAARSACTRCWTPRRPCASRRHPGRRPSRRSRSPSRDSPPVTPGRTGTRSPAWT